MPRLFSHLWLLKNHSAGHLLPISRFLHFLIFLLPLLSLLFICSRRIRSFLLRCERQKLFSFLCSEYVRVCVWICIRVFFALKQSDSESRLIGNSSINTGRNTTIIGNNGDADVMDLRQTCLGFLTRVLSKKQQRQVLS